MEPRAPMRSARLQRLLARADDLALERVLATTDQTLPLPRDYCESCMLCRAATMYGA